MSSPQACSLVLQEQISKKIDFQTAKRLTRIEEEIVSGPIEDWHDGIHGLLPSQSRNFQRIEKLSSFEKEFLLAELKKSLQFQATPESYQQLFKMGLNDFESWQKWIDVIHIYGMNRQTPIEFKKTIQMMPEPLRKKIVETIANVYKDKHRQGHLKILSQYSFNDFETNILTREEKNEILQLWEDPKRIFDQLIPMLTMGPQSMRANIKSGMAPISAYEIYLSQLRTWMKGFLPRYNAYDIVKISLAMQEKLKQILTDPQYLEKSGFFKSSNAYIVIYGSFPNGRADFQNGSDFDIAVSYEKLASGEHEKNKTPLRYDNPIHLSTWEIENAGIEVLRQRFGIETFYDPTKHKSITEKQIYAKNLASLSPLRIKISADKIEVQIDDPDAEDRFFGSSFFGGRTMTAELN